MEFIIANEKGEEVTLLTDKQYIDMEIGEGNTFSIQIDKKYKKKWGIDSGWWIGCPGTEYGGIINKVVSSDNVITISGSTWRGMLTKKILQPPSGEDYLSVSGDADSIINNVICSEFSGIFVCDTLSGVQYSGYKFDRYVNSLAGIEKMLFSKNLKLSIEYDSGEPNGKSFVRIKSTPIHDFSDEIEYSKDGTLSYIYFSFEKFTGGINHLICLGKGELKDRLVLHLYADENGNIGTEQHFFGAEEREATYDYSSASSEEDLRKNGTEKFKELLSYKSMDMDLFNESLAGLRGINDDISIGDIVGGRDFDTGIYLSKQITRKIVQVKNGRESIEYGVGKPVLNRNSANAPVEQSDPLDKLIKVTTDGTGLSVGKDAELNKTFDIGLQMYLREKLLIEFNKFIFMKTSDGTPLGVMGITNENELIINWDGYDAKRGSTSVYGNKVNIVGNNIALQGTIAVNGVSMDLNNRVKTGAPQMATAKDFIAHVSGLPGYTFVGRWKDTGGWGPTGVVNTWYRGFCMLQNAQGGTSDVAGFIFCNRENAEKVYVGYVTGTTTPSITWLKLPTLRHNSAWNNTAAQQLYIAASDETAYRAFLGVKNSAWTFCPGVSKNLQLGNASYLWGNIFSASSTITTSDRKQKKGIQPLTEQHFKFFAMLQPVSFQFVDGTSGRTHIGFISQDVEQAMTACGLTDLDFAGFCKDQKVISIENEDGTFIEQVVEGEYIYSLRYEEFIALNTYVIQKQQSEIETLKNEIEKIKKAIGL